MFANVQQEQAFSVRGGIVWFNHVLVAAVELSGSYGVSHNYSPPAQRLAGFELTSRSTDPSVLPRPRTCNYEYTIPRTLNGFCRNPLACGQLSSCVYCRQHNSPFPHPHDARYCEAATVREYQL